MDLHFDFCQLGVEIYHFSGSEWRSLWITNLKTFHFFVSSLCLFAGLFIAAKPHYESEIVTTHLQTWWFPNILPSITPHRGCLSSIWRYVSCKFGFRHWNPVMTLVWLAQKTILEGGPMWSSVLEWTNVPDGHRNLAPKKWFGSLEIDFSILPGGFDANECPAGPFLVTVYLK